MGVFGLFINLFIPYPLLSGIYYYFKRLLNPIQQRFICLSFMRLLVIWLLFMRGWHRFILAQLRLSDNDGAFNKPSLDDIVSVFNDTKRRLLLPT